MLRLSFLLLLTIGTSLSSQPLDLDREDLFAEWTRSMESTPVTTITSVAKVEKISPKAPGGECTFEVRDSEGKTYYPNLFKNCACACLTSERTDPREIQECIDACVLPGTFEGGTYNPADKAVEKLYEAGDFKTFYDFSLRGNGGAFGVAYEITDGRAKLPFLGREYRKPDDKTGQCPSGWVKDNPQRCSRQKRIPMTTELGLSEKAIGFHLGWKILPIFEGGVFTGVKYNFKESEMDLTLGLQWIKLRF